MNNDLFFRLVMPPKKTTKSCYDCPDRSSTKKKPAKPAAKRTSMLTNDSNI